MLCAITNEFLIYKEPPSRTASADVPQRRIMATINVRINAACPMIDRRRIMTPSAHNGNIRRAQPGAW